MVRIVQCLCPSRHCIFAISYLHPDLSDEDAIRAAQAMWQEMQGQGVNPWCALCNSRSMFFEAGETRFKTMEEAYPHLKEMELRQVMTQLHLLSERN